MRYYEIKCIAGGVFTEMYFERRGLRTLDVCAERVVDVSEIEQGPQEETGCE